MFSWRTQVSTEMSSMYRSITSIGAQTGSPSWSVELLHFLSYIIILSEIIVDGSPLTTKSFPSGQTREKPAQASKAFLFSSWQWSMLFRQKSLRSHSLTPTLVYSCGTALYQFDRYYINSILIMELTFLFVSPSIESKNTGWYPLLLLLSTQKDMKSEWAYFVGSSSSRLIP